MVSGVKSRSANMNAEESCLLLANCRWAYSDGNFHEFSRTCKLTHTHHMTEGLNESSAYALNKHRLTHVKVNFFSAKKGNNHNVWNQCASHHCSKVASHIAFDWLRFVQSAWTIFLYWALQNPHQCVMVMFLKQKNDLILGWQYLS